MSWANLQQFCNDFASEGSTIASPLMEVSMIQQNMDGCREGKIFSALKYFSMNILDKFGCIAPCT